MSAPEANDGPTLAFCDCETDGVHPGRQPWEIAVIRRTPDGQQVEHELFVEIDLSTSDPYGLRVGGFYDRHPLGQWLSGQIPGELPPMPGEGWRSNAYVSRRKAAHAVARWTHRAHVVGAVPSFDADTFDRFVRGQQLTGSWDYHLIDVGTLAAGWLAGCGKPLPPLPWKSGDVAEWVGARPTRVGERHHALADAALAMRIYDRIVGGAS